MKHDRPDPYESPDGLCVFPLCDAATTPHLALPLCNRHILKVHRDAKFLIDEAAPPRGRAKPLMKHAPGCIYFIRFGGLVKIGFTTNLVQRLKALPHEELLGIKPGTMADEKALHGRFAHLRRTGEWFNPERELLDYIETLNEAA